MVDDLKKRFDSMTHEEAWDTTNRMLMGHNEPGHKYFFAVPELPWKKQKDEETKETEDSGDGCEDDQAVCCGRQCRC